MILSHFFICDQEEKLCAKIAFVCVCVARLGDVDTCVFLKVCMFVFLTGR